MINGIDRPDKLTEKTLSSRTVYRGRIFTVKADEVELPDGSSATRDVVVHSGGVGVLAVDNNDNVILVRQFRYGIGRVSLEIPAGKRNNGEDPGECGKRELEEETGYSAGKFTRFGSLDPTPAYVSEVIYLYLAKDLKHTGQNLDDDEFLLVEHVPLEEAVAMCMDGRITDSKTLVAVLKYARYKQEI